MQIYRNLLRILRITLTRVTILLFIKKLGNHAYMQLFLCGVVLAVQAITSRLHIIFIYELSFKQYVQANTTIVLLMCNAGILWQNLRASTVLLLCRGLGNKQILCLLPILYIFIEVV